MEIKKSPLKLLASPKAVITKFLSLPGESRMINLIQRVKNLPADEVRCCLDKVMKEFATRHRDIYETLLKHSAKAADQYKDVSLDLSKEQKLLLGAFLTKEYSIQAAALFNPSIVPHPDQQGLQPGEQRFVISLRATGEGHISSVVFKTGIVDALANITLDKDAAYFSKLEKNENAIYSKAFIKKRASFFPGFKTELLDLLPVFFTSAQAIELVGDCSMSDSVKQLAEILDTNYELESSVHLPFNERVIFPNAKAESMGIEDVRFVKLEDGDSSCYYGSYTAYNGHQVKIQLIETIDFDVFKIRTLYGDAISDKGMALFPEKINGKYAMVSRQGGEKISIMFSEDLYVWNKFQTLMEPLHAWEFVQLGNCGSPIKTDEGWLLLTHGVGAMRTYVISAILLSLQDPTIIIRRLNKPFLEARGEEREGYVPNVVYTCGLLRHQNKLIIPYAVSDSATGFVTIELNEILNELMLCQS